LVPVSPLTLRPPSPVIPGELVTQDPEPQQFSNEQPLLDPLGHALRDQTVSASPLTLRPPSPVIPGEPITQDPEPQEFPSEKPLLDPLGHALRDQTVSAYLSSTVTPKSSVHTHAAKDTGHEVSAHLSSTATPKPSVPGHAPKETEDEALPPTQGIPTGVMSDFVVVGAATHKASEGPGSEGVAEFTPDRTVPREHRKLLPIDLRPSTKFRSNKEGAKSRSVRRLAWITKEIEKVEGYTGEKVGGFRYDGDDVIIQLRNAARYKRKQEMFLSSKPPQDRRKPGLSHTPSPRSNTTLIAGPSRNAFGNTHPKGPTLSLSEDSANISRGTTAGGAIAASADVPDPDSSWQSTKNTPSSDKAAAPVLDVLAQKATLTDSAAINDCSFVQARGLGFLERRVYVCDVVITRCLLDAFLKPSINPLAIYSCLTQIVMHCHSPLRLTRHSL
jgi:hypothetical protein